MRANDKTNLERMKELIQILNEADIAYYRDSRPIMTDFDYDRLFDELKGLERDTGLILSNSPTQKVSRRNSGGTDAGPSFKAHAFGRQNQICRGHGKIC